MRFKEAYEDYRKKNLTQSEAALLLGVCDRTFLRYMNRYDEGGLDALLDERLVQVSHRRAVVDEVMQLDRGLSQSPHRLEYQATFTPGIVLTAIIAVIHGLKAGYRKPG